MNNWLITTDGVKVEKNKEYWPLSDGQLNNNYCSITLEEANKLSWVSHIFSSESARKQYIALRIKMFSILDLEKLNLINEKQFKDLCDQILKDV